MKVHMVMGKGPRTFFGCCFGEIGESSWNILRVRPEATPTTDLVHKVKSYWWCEQ
jgi:hypothetical protein